MCRLLCIKSDQPFALGDYLPAFAEMSQNSVEYQGHGWGYAWRDQHQWRMHHSIRPIWEDDLDRTETTSLLLVHARSAFENKDIVIENNMPFAQEPWMFIFNGELRGVRMKIEGRIGAEKVFNLILSRDRGDMLTTLRGVNRLLEQRTANLKAANIMLSNGEAVFFSSNFHEKPDYYTMWRKNQPGLKIICSEPIDDDSNWEPVAQGVEKVA